MGAIPTSESEGQFSEPAQIETGQDAQGGIGGNAMIYLLFPLCFFIGALFDSYIFEYLMRQTIARADISGEDKNFIRRVLGIEEEE